MRTETAILHKLSDYRNPAMNLVAVFCFCFFINFPMFGNTSDSLVNLLSKAKGDRKIEILVALSHNLLNSEPEKALAYGKSALELSKNNKNSRQLSDVYKVIGDAFYVLDSLKSSLFAYSSGVEAEELSKEPRLDSLSHRLSDVAYVFFVLGIPDKALIYDQKALEINKRLNDSIEIAINYVNIGVNLQLMGRYGEAIGTLQEALKIDQKLGKEDDIAVDYNNIGMVYQAWGKFEDAIHFFRLAYDIDQRLGNQQKVAIRLSNIAKVYMEMNEIHKAIENYEKALEIDRSLNVTQKIPVRLQGLGNAYLDLEQYPKALSYFTEALAIFKSLEQEHRIANLLYDIGKVYYKWGQLISAENYYLQSLRLAQKLNLNPEISKAAYGMYLISKTEKDYGKSLEYFEIYNTAKDSLFSENSSRQVEEFRIRYETEKKESENQLLIKENEIRKRTQRFSTILILALLLGSIALFYAFSLKRKSLQQSRILFEKEAELNRLKIDQIEKQNRHLHEVLFAEEEIKKLQLQSIEQKNHELTSATLLIANKNEVFENLRKMAEQISANNPEGNNEKIKEMIREINRQTNVEGQWEQFRVHFESIHKSFFVKLRENNSGLTQADLQLCAYIKLNMGTKEIARLMNITPESVNTHRYRLRKKITLKAEETMDEFIHGL